MSPLSKADGRDGEPTDAHLPRGEDKLGVPHLSGGVGPAEDQ